MRVKLSPSNFEATPMYPQEFVDAMFFPKTSARPGMERSPYVIANGYVPLVHEDIPLEAEVPMGWVKLNKRLQGHSGKPNYGLAVTEAEVMWNFWDRRINGVNYGSEEAIAFEGFVPVGSGLVEVAGIIARSNGAGIMRVITPWKQADL